MEAVDDRKEHLQDRVNILLVDDEPKNLLTLERVLEPLEENLVLAASGKEALKHVLDQNFALILLDVKMPEIDGYEVAELIRHRRESRETPIIFVTGYQEGEMSVFRGYETGAVDYLIKPIQPRILLSKARVFVELHRKTVELARQKEIAVAELRKNLELNKTNELLGRLKKEAEQFASIASHDLQTPLRHISSYIEVLRTDLGDSVTEDQKEALDIIASGARRMKLLINDLLTLSQIGAQSFEPASVDLNALLKDVMAILADPIRDTGARVVAGVLPTVYADEVKIRQVFQNLIGNAIKYRSPERRPEIVISAEELPSGFRLSVSDNGLGIREEHFDRVFKIFQRLHRPDEYSGTGIGLSICEKIVTLHGGRIWLDSVPGKGSVFHFTLNRPLSDEEALG